MVVRAHSCGEPVSPGKLLFVSILLLSGLGRAEPSQSTAEPTAKREPKARAEAKSEPKPQDAKLVVEKPPPWTQKQKTAAERGVNPCNTPDPGFGNYHRWNRDVAMGQMLAPKKGGVNSRGEFDVMIHFHGHEPVRKEWVQVMNTSVLVGIDLGLGSGPYETAFAPHGALRSLVASVERAMSKLSGKEGAHARRIGLSAWSAGYGAIQSILGDPWAREHVDTVVLLDGLHCGYSGKSLNEPQIRPFIEFAREAADGRRLMVVTHSSIIPPGYASTTETANYLVGKLGGHPRKATPRAADPMGLELISRYSRGGFHVRGFSGNDKMDHCAQIGLFRDVLKVHVKPRWSARSRVRR